MQTSSGRDKACAVLQYLIETIGLYLSARELLTDKDKRVIKVCRRVVRSISNSRKMLRFLKCIAAIQMVVRFV